MVQLEENYHSRRAMCGHPLYDPFPAGKGGQAEVWHAYNMGTRTDCAIKRPLLADKRWRENQDINIEIDIDDDWRGYLRNFKREAQIASALRAHPNIVKIMEVHDAEYGIPYIVMEWFDHSLDQLLRDRAAPLDWRTALGYAKQVCEGLFYAHTRPDPVIHRDIKPHNIMINENDVAVICDFGFALTKGQLPGHPRHTGTDEYKAPELWKDDPDPSPLSDIYALGVTLWEMLNQDPHLSAGVRRSMNNMSRKKCHHCRGKSLLV